MSKLPVVSGAECIKALEKIGLKYIDSAAVILSWFANLRPHKPQFPITKSWTAVRYAESSGNPV